MQNMISEVQPTSSTKPKPFSSVRKFFSNNFGVHITTTGSTITTPLGSVIGMAKNDADSPGSSRPLLKP